MSCLRSDTVIYGHVNRSYLLTYSYLLLLAPHPPQSHSWEGNRPPLTIRVQMVECDDFDRDRVCRTSRCCSVLSLSISVSMKAGDIHKTAEPRRHPHCLETVQQSMRRHASDVLLQCIGPPTMPAVGRSPASQPQSNWSHQIACRQCYCVRRVPLIILRTILSTRPLRRGTTLAAVRTACGELRQFIDWLMQCAASSSSSSVSVSPSRSPSAWSSACYGRDNRPVFTVNFIVCRQARDELQRCWLWIYWLNCCMPSTSPHL